MIDKKLRSDNNNNYFITGSYLALELDDVLSSRIAKSGSLFIYEDAAGTSVSEVAERWANALLSSASFKNADTAIVDLSVLLYSSDIKTADEKSIGKLINAFRDLLPKMRILLISVNIPGYYITDGDLARIYPKYAGFEDKVENLKRLEQRFISETMAVLIDTTKYYFYRKEKGFILKTGLYEEDCYRDIASKVEKYIADGTDIAPQPDFNISLERYIKYAHKVDIYEIPFVFLDVEDVVELFILSSEVDYVRENADELRLLHDMKIPSPWKRLMKIADKTIGEGNKIGRHRKFFILLNKNKALIPYKKVIISEIKRKLCKGNISKQLAAEFTAFVAASLGIYNDKQSDYRSLFKNSIVCRPMFEIIRRYACDNKLAFAKQLTSHNAGYYFAHMIGDPTHAEEYMGEDYVFDPVLVDDLGSCVTRAALNELFTDNHTIALNEMWLQVPHYTLSSGWNPSLSELFNFENPGWAEKNIIVQFKGKMEECIRNSDAKWLLMDFFALITPQTYQYKGFVFTDMSEQYAAQIGAKECSPIDDPGILGTWDEIIKKMDPIFDICLEKYGKRIILAETICMKKMLGDDGKYYRPWDTEETDRQNAFLKQAFDHAKEYLGCYTIEIANNYTSDERGYRGSYIAHYSIDYYKELCGFIDHIIRNEPEQKSFGRFKTSPESSLEELPITYPRPKKRKTLWPE